MVLNYSIGRSTSSASNFLDIFGWFWQGRGMKFTEAAWVIASTPEALDAEEAAIKQREATLRAARRTWIGIDVALNATPPTLSAFEAADQCGALLATLNRTVEAPEGSPGRKTRGPDKVPRRPRKGPPGDGPPIALSDEDRAVLRSALETYGPLTLLALSEAFTVHKLTPLQMPLEEALTSTDEFCSWRPTPVVETGHPDLWGTLFQFETAVKYRMGSIEDATWSTLPIAVTTVMDKMGCGAIAARRVLDMAIARRAVAPIRDVQVGK